MQAGLPRWQNRETSNRLQRMSYSQRISVVLPTQAKKEKDLEKLCDIEKRSISNFVYLLIQDAIDQAKTSSKLKLTDD
ncbi:ribbon-helix-helix domain-containing protein [Microcoleus sp. MON2_D5]|uniref:ribbon-helix-helix domain-containing protein n=1 Tax=Microcoleus sp. MON2_D5 TaxID=2818833 RepID=UPI002FD751EA